MTVTLNGSTLDRVMVPLTHPPTDQSAPTRVQVRARAIRD
jgi:hypothetical protein